MDWAWQLEHGGQTPMPGKQHYNNEGDLIKEVKTELEKGLAKTEGKEPQIMVIGAKGRCGGGALDLCRAVGLESNLLEWDMEETAKGGPFVEIRESDVSTLLGARPSTAYIDGLDFYQLHIFERRHPEVRYRRFPQERQKAIERCLRRQL